MRIQLLTSFDLFPPVHGGSSIAYNFIKHAAARHEVSALISHLYALPEPVPSPNGRDDGHFRNDNVHIEYCRPSSFDRLRVLSFLVNPHYYRAADRLCQDRRPDVIQCETLWPVLAGWRLQRRHHLPLVCVQYNVEGDKFADLGRPRPLVAVVRAVERFACRRADAMITVSEADRQQIIRQYQAPHDRVRTIQPSPDLADFCFDERARTAVRGRYGLDRNQALLTFVGNLKYEPNQEAVRRIADYIYPAVMQEHPKARFVIVGQGAELLTSCRREHLDFTGYLTRQDLVAHLSATDVFLVPVETGSGIRIKIPEATACGRAVVATRKAAQGLEAFQDDEIVRAEGVGPEFVGAVLRLIADPTLRSAIGARARTRTVETFGWQKTLAAYERVYAQIGAL
jgi:glycosyltransferase involved in cell wall biosynthesis